MNQKIKPNFSLGRLAQLRTKHAEVAKDVDAERPLVEQEWREFVHELTHAVAKHTAAIDDYATKHNLTSRADVIEIALSKLFAK